MLELNGNLTCFGCFLSFLYHYIVCCIHYNFFTPDILILLVFVLCLINLDWNRYCAGNWNFKIIDFTFVVYY